MQLTLHFHRLTNIRILYMEYEGKELSKSNTCPLKNLGFQLFSKTRWRNICGCQKIQPVNYDVANVAKQ